MTNLIGSNYILRVCSADCWGYKVFIFSKKSIFNSIYYYGQVGNAIDIYAEKELLFELEARLVNGSEVFYKRDKRVNYETELEVILNCNKGLKSKGNFIFSDRFVDLFNEIVEEYVFELGY